LDKAVRAADSEEEEASVVAEASVAEEASVVAEVSSNERFRFPKRDSL
jgi:division protein CdvB (Snf7/Vps24/ESCRT-III family)